MRNQLVYDLPMRMFHWLFAIMFAGAFIIAKTVDDESQLFTYHMLAGFVLGFIVIFRIVWGFVGAKHSRFTSFALRPKDLVAYFVGILKGEKHKWSGHNPASSWAALVMFFLALGLGVTGYLMGNGQKEQFEDLHELLANGFLVVVLMHIAGVVLHSVRHQDGIAMTMVDGMKFNVPDTEVIPSARPVAALLFVGLVATFAVYLASNFDTQAQTLNFLGTTLQLGEEDESAGDTKSPAGNKSDDGDEDDDDDDGDDD